jgi:ABC-2 type transport system ATP-binding protein
VTAPIVTCDLAKHFGEVKAVDGLDLEVAHGEVFGFLGPNGAGKTTTIRLLLDFLRPTRGTTTLLGGSGADPEVRRRIGYLPADLALDPRYTGSDVFEFFGGLRGTVDDQKKTELIERFGLDPRRPIRELSTGNRRKVGIVQAFMHRPDLLILDEPTSGLDPLLQHEFHTLVGEETARGVTVFLSSHVLPEVEVLAHRVGIISRGRLITVADIGELRQKARQRIEIRFARDVDATEFEGLPGVSDVTASDATLHLTIDGPVDPVIKAAARHEVARIISHEADLEDVFLELYGEGSAG